MPDLKHVLENDDLFFDNAIVSHGYAPYMRDYDIIAEVVAPVPGAEENYIEGRYRYRFTHCPEVSITTAVSEKAWRESWDDTFTDLTAWRNAGEPDGFVWGVCWADAYPGMFYVDDSQTAISWSRRLGREMHEVRVETNAFTIRLVCHELRRYKMAEGDPVTQELTPLDPEQPL
jgi:hypothetical protein